MTIINAPIVLIARVSDDGYDFIDEATRHGWHVVPSWGARGWDLGEWPYVVYVTRERPDLWELAVYCEGDCHVASFPTEAERTERIDSLAHAQWTRDGERWMRTESQQDLCGPYTRGRQVAHELGEAS